tara:strand:+ start:1145 stop:1756 length:612 start_codon:yes stop_codon:yes gene_type:complete
MVDIEQEILEAYFESNGFLVRQAGKPNDSESKKKSLPLPTIAVLNPAVQSSDPNLSFRLFTGDLKGVRSALVSRLGWENSSFSNSILNSDAKLMKFFKQEVTQERISLGYNPGPELPESWMGSYLCLLVVPALPRNEVKLKDLFVLFREMGVGGVLCLSSMLENLLRQSMPTLKYSNNGVFQMLKLLKVYQLAREPQLDMFSN